jgi:hypothetical protein
VLANVPANSSVLLLVFIDESESAYHGATLTNPMSSPTAEYSSDADLFVDTLHPAFSSFQAINYPIVRQTQTNKEYVQHTIAAIEARELTEQETTALNNNPYFTTLEWLTVESNLRNNPYVGQPILKDYGWSYKENRVNDLINNGSPECPVDGISVITPCQFTVDIEELIFSTTVEIEVEVDVIVREVEYEEGSILSEPIEYDLSWTMSYDLEDKEWISWHSYMPNFYFYRLQEFHSWQRPNDNLTRENNIIWRHNTPNSYQTFYGKYFPHIIEYVDNAAPKETKIWEQMVFQTRAEQYFPKYDQFLDKDVTFNQILAYTSKQATGWQNIIPKVEEEGYLDRQITNNFNDIIADRNERTWTLNDLRDITVDYNIPIFTRDVVSLSSEYYTDKVLNFNAVDYNKPWYELQSLRDKYLVVRLKFDNFDNIRLVTNFTDEIENKSYR